MQEKTLEEDYHEMVERVHKETFGKTLEELDSFFNWAEQIKDEEVERWKLMYGVTPEELKNWLRTALEKAREEGRKQDYKIIEQTVITQYKEELLGYLNKRIEYFDKKTRQAQSGKDEHSKKLTVRWSAKRECLSEVKKLIN